MELGDLAGVGKALEKLLDVIQAGTGNLFKARMIRRNADAKAYEIRKIAETLNEQGLLIGQIDYKDDSLSITSTGTQIEPALPYKSFAERTVERMLYQEAKKQSNIENICLNAAEELNSQEQISEEHLDEDWITRFFRIAEDISTEEMQTLWGKVLAGEVSKPKSYSLRTLEALKTLTQREAEVFTKVAQAALSAAAESFIVVGRNDESLPVHFGTTFQDIQLLRDIGMLAANSLDYQFLPVDRKAASVINYGNVVMVVERDANTPRQALRIAKYTEVGKELLSLVSITPNLKYIEQVAKSLRREGVCIKYGELNRRENDVVYIKNPQIITFDEN